MRLLLALYHLRRLRRLRYKLEGRPAPLGLLDVAAVVACGFGPEVLKSDAGTNRGNGFQSARPAAPPGPPKRKSN